MQLGGVDIVERQEWGATAPLGPLMPLPATGAFLHHSVTTAHDTDELVEATDDAYGDMRRIEAIGVARFGRFSYSWAVHPNGTVMMGAGFNVGAHTANHNSKTFGVVLIGNYQDQPMNDVQVWHAGMLLAGLANAGHLRRDFELRGHRDVKATACPGANAYARMWEVREIARVITHHGVPAPGPTPPLPPQPVANAWPGRYIKVKQPLMSGADVRRWQESCRIGTGAPSGVDGIYGAQSRQAALNLQRWGGLDDDGVVGPKTWDLAEYLRSLK